MGMDVIEIPTNRPVQRVDLDERRYYMTKESKNSVRSWKRSKKSTCEESAGTGRYDHDRDLRTAEQHASERGNRTSGTECEVP